MNECPYCLSRLSESEETTACDACGRVYHAECWAENGGCCVKECPAMARNVEIDLPRENHDKLVLSRESVESAVSHRPRTASNPCMACGRQIPEGQLYCADCTPIGDGSPDSRNVGPLLVMLLVAALLAALLYLFKIQDEEQKSTPPPPAPGTTRVLKR